MAHIEDRWTQPGPNGRRVKSPRYGTGKRWLAVWQEPGGVRRKQAFVTKDAAAGRLADVDVAQRAGTYVRPSAVTVAEFGDRWVTLQLHHRASTSEQLESRWRLHIRPALGHLRLGDVTPGMVQDAVARWAGTLAPSTVEVTYAYASSLFAAAVADRIIPVSPCQRIRLPAVTRERVIPLTVGQVLEIAEAMTRPNRRGQYRGMVLLGAATGLRPGELRGLTVDRCRFDGGGLVVTVDRQLTTTGPTWGPPKTASSYRDVPADEDTARMLREHIATHPPHPSGLIFTGRERGPLARNSAGEAWHRATVGLGLPPRSGWHMLRHFHASMLIAGGLSPVAVAARLGHKDARETLETYGHLWHDDDARAVDAVTRGLWRPPQSPQGLRIVR